MSDQNFQIKEPLLVCFKVDDSIITHVYPPESYNAKHYGLLLADCARHIANALGDKSSVDVIVDYFNREMANPTTKISRPS